MLCEKHKYDRDVIIIKCLGFYDLKGNKRLLTKIWSSSLNKPANYCV